MPWRDVRPMDEKVLFIADYLRQLYTFTELCGRYEISRKTGYKWIKRYRQQDLQGLAEQSRRPQQSPQRTPYRIRKAIVELRQRGCMVLGPKKIRALLEQRFPDQPIPSKTTIYKILNAEGMVLSRRRKRRVRPDDRAFAPVNAVNDLWSVDFKGQFKMQDGQWCYPLTVMDHHSRYLLCCVGMPGTRGKETREAFTKLFEVYGLPKRIRSDNGVPFASTATAGLSTLAVWWIKLGIQPERIEPGKPQQNGRHERMHRTLKQAVVRPPAGGMRSQQKRFDQFRRSYNEQRPHEALNQKTPASMYRPSLRRYQPPTSPSYPDYFEVRRVKHDGLIYWRGYVAYISYLLEDEDVGIEQTGESTWDVYFGPIRLGQLDEAAVRSKGYRKGYLSVGV